MESEKKKQTKRRRRAAEHDSARKELYEWIQSLMTALVICVVVFLFLARVIDVVGDSMNPTLYDGNKMLVSDLFYHPKQGDVVIFKKDEYDPDKALVKRVIAVEGQVVNIDFDNGVVYVDGVPLDEPYVNSPTNNKEDFIGPKTVPEGCVFVMGDNRNASTDSRDKRIEMVDERLIVGRAYLVIYPVAEIRWIQ